MGLRRGLDRRLRRRLLLLLFDDFLESPRLCFLDGRLLLCDVLLLLSHRRGRERARPLRRLRRERRREVEVVVLLEQAFGDALERVQPEALPSRVPGQTAAAGRLRRRGSSSRNGLRGGDGSPRAAERRLEYRGRRLRRRRRGAGAGERPGTVFRGFPLRRAFRRERRRRERRRSRTGCRRGCPRARRALYCRARREREGLRSRARRGDALSVRVDRRDLPERRDVQRRGRTRLGRDGGELPQVQKIIVPGLDEPRRGHRQGTRRRYTREARVRQPATGRASSCARARDSGGTRGNAAFRETLSEVRSHRFFGCICHPTRQEQTRDSRFGPGGKICSAAAAAFRVLFISRSPIAAPRQRHAAPRAGVPFPTMAGALTLHGGLAAAAPAKLASQVRASRGAPVAPDASAKTRIAPRSRAVLDGRVLQGTRTSDDEPPADRDPPPHATPTLASDAFVETRRRRRSPRVAPRSPPPRACRPPPSRGSA